MPKLICHVPLKVRFVGEPTEEAWAALEERLTVRFSLALRRGLEQQGQSRLKGKSIQECFDQTRETVEGYLLPSYEGGGTPVRTPVVRRPADGPLHVNGDDNNENVYRLLGDLTKRLLRLRGVTLGRVTGSDLEYGNGQYRLRAFPPLPELETVSLRLGEGVFLMRSIPRQSAGLAALMAGGAYEFLSLDARGQSRETGLRVIAAGLAEIPEGILIYSARRQFVDQTVIVVKRPRNVAALAQRCIEALDIPFASLSPGITVIHILAILEPEQLLPEGTMALLEELRRRGRLGDFLNLVRSQGLRDYLKRQGVEWGYLFSNWKSSFNDNAAFFAGYMIGAAENVYEGFRLIGVLIGALFSKELANESANLWEGMKQFFRHPIITSTKGLEQLRDSFGTAMLDLNFFEAGRITGNVVVVLLTLPEAIRSLPRAAQGLVKVAGVITRLSLVAVQELGVSLRTLVQFVRQPVRVLALPDGIMLMKVGEEIEITNQAGHVTGRLVPREFKPAELAEWEKGFREPAGPPEPHSKPVEPPVPLWLNLRDIVSNAIAEVRRQLGGRWARNPEFGTRLHKVVADMIIAAGGTPAGYRVFVESTFSQILHLPEDVAKLKLKDYIAARPHLREFLNIPQHLLESEVGNLKPDLVLFSGGKIAALWDLTSLSGLEHLAKTQLYAHILQDLGGLSLVSWWETYWTEIRAAAPPAAASPAAVAPAAGAASKAAKQSNP